MNLPEIELDPRNELELWEQAANHAFNRSGGQLSAFHPGDPLSVLLEGQVYAGAELLWYLNKLPSKLLAYWLSGYGLSTSDGAKATGTVTVNLATTPSPSIIPSGTRFSTGSEIYETIATVSVPSGSSEVTLSVTAIENGAQYNVPPFSINRIITPVPYSRSVYNISPITGGSDAMTSEALISEFIKSHFDGMVISAQDLEASAKTYLGSGWVVRLSVNLDPSTGLEAPGTIAVLIDNPEFQAVPVGVLSGLQSYLNSVCPINFSPWCSDLKRQLIEVRLSISHLRDTDPAIVAENIYQQLREAGDLPEIDDRVLAPMVYRAGGIFSTVSIDGHPTVARRSNSRLHLFYLEILAIDEDGLESIHIFGNGDQD